MLPSQLPPDFLPMADLDDFAAAKPRLDRLREALETACACGALLKLEKAFKRNPCASAVSVSFNYESIYDVRAVLVSPSGLEADSNDVALALLNRDEATGQGASGGRLASIPSSMRRPDLAQAFSEFSLEAISKIEEELRDAMLLFSWRAPDLFGSKVAPACPLRNGTAVEIARAAGLHEAAAIIEASRISKSSARPDAAKASPPRI